MAICIYAAFALILKHKTYSNLLMGKSDVYFLRHPGHGRGEPSTGM
ncbi:MAG: hypothetical protein AB4426_33135 [Xenococcaceae cyanobacterium]